MKKQDMNLLTVYDKIHKQRANQNAVGRIYGLVFIGVVLITGAFYVVIFFQNEMLLQRIAEIETHLASPQVVERKNEVTQLNSDIQTLEEMLTEIANAQAIFDLQPKLSTSLMNLLLAERPGTVRINYIHFTGDTIVLDISGTRVYSTSDYVMRLRRLNTFQEVTFSGYDLESGVFNSTITVVLRGGQ